MKCNALAPSVRLALAAWLSLAACEPANTDLGPVGMSERDAARTDTPTVRRDAAAPTDLAAVIANPDAARSEDGPATTPSDAASIDALGMQKRCSAPLDPEKPIARLSETGCVDPKNPARPPAGLLPYEVNSPLWSDGTDKGRWFALPAGKKIRVKDCKRAPGECAPVHLGGTPWDDGHFEFPDGTVLVKNFGIGALMVETRLLVKFSRTRWVGYSYIWNAEQTDAQVIEKDTGAVDKDFSNPKRPGGKQTWTYPSREDCMTCHLDEAGVQLGLQLVQLNRDVAQPNGGKLNQLKLWETLGLFEAPLPNPLPAPLPDPAATTGTVEQRARSYLHANCAICHRPGSNYPDIDLRWTTTLNGTNICNVPNNKGDLGVADAMRFVPGRPDRSTLSLRMKIRDQGQMPQIATRYVDNIGVAAVEQWIKSVSKCP